MPCLKKFTETKWRRYTGQQQRTKSGRRLANKPIINREETVGFASPSVYVELFLPWLQKGRSEQLFLMPSRTRRTVVS